MALVGTKAEFRNIRKELRAEGKKVVLCHGVFDLVHPGHIIHFEEAKKMGDVLVASVTAAKYVRKGPDRPYFGDEMRLKFLSSIAYIDYILLSEGFTVDDIIEAAEPDLYVKGSEYQAQEDDITGKIAGEIELVRKHGGEIAYTGGQVFSSTKLINHAFPSLSEEVKQFMKSFSDKYSLSEIRALAEKISGFKIAVIGDVIIDEYIYCNVQGLMSKDRGYSARYRYVEQYLGGSLAVARHIASFCDDVTLLSVVGKEEAVHSRMLDELGDKMRIDVTFSDVFETIIKTRYVSMNEKREELDKIFAVNNLPVYMRIDKPALDKFKEKIKEKIEQCDVVILCDFGHGLIDEEVMDLIQSKAKFLALNCQTNSSNYGKNLITKYKRADVFAIDQKELGLAFANYRLDEQELLQKLEKHLDCHGWLTQGSQGAVSIEDGEIKHCPAFVLKVKDTIGAGDAFFSIASLFAAAGASMEMGTFMGNIAGALATNIVGNKKGIDKVDVLKYASTLLNI